MEVIIFWVVVIGLCALFFMILPYLIPFILILAIIGWINRKRFESQRPADIPDNPYEEIYGNNTRNPFDDEYTTHSNPDVIDVEYTEHEDNENDPS